MKLTRRTVLAAAAVSPMASPMVARAGTYALKPQADGFAAVLETKDFMALASDPVAAAELQRALDRHLVLHVRPEAPLTREAVGRMAYHLGYQKNPNPRPGRNGAAPSEFSFIADFGGPAQGPLTAPREPGYLESLHYDGVVDYSCNTTIDVPPTTPHTFSDCRAAYRALPKDLKRVVETSFALHAGMATPQTPYKDLPALDRATASRRPMLVKHFRTGEPLLHIPKNPASVIEGMDETEGKAILADLWARVNASRFRYFAVSGDNETIYWDNFGTLHTNPSYDRTKARVTWFFTIPGQAKPIVQAKVA